MKSAVITFPGSNCDRDALDALNKVSTKVQKIWHAETNLDNDLDLIIIPGGFSFGDYLRSGAMASISPVMNEVKRLSQKGVRILGICNGFQILTESNLLPGALLRNEKIKFICRQLYLRVENTNTDFTNKYKNRQIIKIPIAHMDGNFFAPNDVIKMIEDNNMVAFRYVDKLGNVANDSNPNGSILNIAGVYNKNKNVLGMMPHPERAIDVNTGSNDGSLLFESLKVLF
ncbi:MAG: phosphoribosylformylglycinamidine synthase subunit PurQ [Proteobacteria bacterium]|nr:phosphoribosylformylglycinamidine synthase subunit PurQ [Pseudomonadota bacterium]NCA28704.1 phosphoribosylformylglycinamidine synthase subunit PurQ [Pseudomonadota bacterium]